jgi:hypothetical protein
VKEQANPLLGNTQMHTESRFYREYEIQVTQHPPGWQAAIYATKPGLPEVDWTTDRIWAANINGAYMMAEQRINEVLSASRPQLPETVADDQAR